MGFFEGAPLEFLLIFVIALVVLGPEGLPDAARKVGGFIRQARAMINEVTQEFRTEFDTLDQARQEVKRLAALPQETLKSAFAPITVGAGSADGSGERELDPRELYYGATVEKTPTEKALEEAGRYVPPPEFVPTYIPEETISAAATQVGQPASDTPPQTVHPGMPADSTALDDAPARLDFGQYDNGQPWLSEPEFYPTPAARDLDVPQEEDAGLSDMARQMMQKSRAARVVPPPPATMAAPHKPRVAARHGVQGRRREEQH